MGLLGSKKCSICGEETGTRGNKAVTAEDGVVCKTCAVKAGFDDPGTLKHGTTATIAEIKKRQGMTADERKAYIKELIEARGEWQPPVQSAAQPAASTAPITCPRCGSDQISADKKGYGVVKGAVGAVVAGPVGLAAGNIGAKKVIVTCLKCGKQWEAGK